LLPINLSNKFEQINSVSQDIPDVGMMSTPAASSTANSLLSQSSLFDVSNLNQLNYYAELLCHEYIKSISKVQLFLSFSSSFG
jgi:hypothetical protein